jgi:hypothetical protein
MKLLSLSIALVSFIGLATAQTVPSYVPVSGLEAWYSFNGSATDSSGNGNNGTVHGATPVNNRLGIANSAYSFNGINNYIIIPSSPSLNITADVSILAWVKSNYTSTGQAQIYFRGDTRSPYDPYLMYRTYDSISFLRNVGLGYTFNSVSFPISMLDTSMFHMFAGTYSASDDSMKIYLDGALIKKAYRPGVISYYTDSAHNTVGACDYGTWQFFNGIIDDIGTWNKRLSDCEISKLYLGTPTLITSNPANCSTTVGGTANFIIY